MALIGMKAPSFTAQAVVNGINIVNSFSLEQFLNKQEVILFFYPKDFTYICPTELLKLQEKLKHFHERGVAVVGCSTDTEETHQAWLNTPCEKGGIQGVTYPLIADSSKTIATNFGVLAGEWKVDDEGQLVFKGSPVAYRATFFIDKKGIIRHECINDLPLGRNIDEILRIIDMWHHIQQYGNVCPVNWEKGDKDLSPTPKGIAQYLSTHKHCKCGKPQCGCKASCC